MDGTKILAQDDGNLLIFKYGADGIIGFNYKGVGEYYYKKNIQGDILAITNSAGEEIVNYVYDAWGNHKTLILSNNGKMVLLEANKEYTEIELNRKLIAELNPFRYRGYYFDTETNLYYLNSRYYDPEICRFVNADSLNYLNPNAINGLNLYNYCGNNPINNVDYSGNITIPIEYRTYDVIDRKSLLDNLIIGTLIFNFIVETKTNFNTLYSDEQKVIYNYFENGGLVVNNGFGFKISENISSEIGYTIDLVNVKANIETSISFNSVSLSTSIGIEGVGISLTLGNNLQTTYSLNIGWLTILAMAVVPVAVPVVATVPQLAIATTVIVSIVTFIGNIFKKIFG